MSFLGAPAQAAAQQTQAQGALVQGQAAVEQGQAVATAALYQAQVAQNNATIAGQNADYATAAGQTQAAITSMKGAATGGAIKAAQAASGIDVNTGSAVDVQASARELSKLDTETVLNNAELSAYGYRAAAVSDKAQAGLYQQEAAQAPLGAAYAAEGAQLSAQALGEQATATQLTGIGGALSTAASLGTKWLPLAG